MTRKRFMSWTPSWAVVAPRSSATCRLNFVKVRSWRILAVKRSPKIAPAASAVRGIATIRGRVMLRKSHAQRPKRSKTAISPYGARLSCVSHNSLSHEKKTAVTAVHARRKHLPIFPKRSFRAFLRRVGFLKRRLGLGKFALFLKGAAQISMKERLARIECDGLFVSMSPMEGSIARFSATRQSDRVYDRGTASVRRRHDPNTVYPKCKHTYLLKATRWKRRRCPRGKNT